MCFELALKRMQAVKQCAKHTGVLVAVYSGFTKLLADFKGFGGHFRACCNSFGECYS